MERFSPCRSEMDFLVLFKCIVPNRPISNKVIMSGAIVVKENITRPIELKTKITRCNMDMSYCVNYDTLTIATMCSKFIDKLSPWSTWAESFEPRFQCPLLENTYSTVNASLDLTAVAKLPIEGFHWILKFEFSELATEEDAANSSEVTHRSLLCLDSDITVRIPRSSRKKSWSSRVYKDVSDPNEATREMIINY